MRGDQQRLHYSYDAVGQLLSDTISAGLLQYNKAAAPTMRIAKPCLGAGAIGSVGTRDGPVVSGALGAPRTYLLSATVDF